MADSERTFTADVENMKAAIGKITDQNKAMEKSMLAAAKAAEAGAKLAQQAWQQQNQETKNAISENEKLRGKIDELKHAQQEMGETGSKIFEGMAHKIGHGLVDAVKE